jgi:hypothetical protein
MFVYVDMPSIVKPNFRFYCTSPEGGIFCSASRVYIYIYIYMRGLCFNKLSLA